MKKIILSAASLAVAAVASVSVAPTTSEAVPAFARQTGAACLNCHFQAIPRLAQMGRDFKIGGFRDISQDVLEDEHLSLPAQFNGSVLFKARIASVTGTGNTAYGTSETSAIQYPDEAALLIGGRMSENIGSLVEWNGGPLSYKIAYVADMDAGQLGFVLASTDALGTAYAFNDPSNVLVRNTRGSQFRPNYFKGTSMQQGVSGLGAYFKNDSVYAALGQFASNQLSQIGVDGLGNPANGNEGVDVLGDGSFTADFTGAPLVFKTWLRAAWMGDVAGFDTVAGAYSISGTQGDLVGVDVYGASSAIELGESTTGVDVQMQGDLGDMSLGLYVSYQASGVTTVNGADQVDHNGYYVLADLGLTHAAGVRLGYASAVNDVKTVGGTKTTTTTTVIGAWYDLAQNVAVDLEMQSDSSDATGSVDKSTTTLLLEYVY